MSDDKGKGRASHRAEDAPRDESPKDPSVVSRIAASASGLTRSAFARPSGNELSEATAAALTNAGKGQSSSTGEGSAWAQSSSATQDSNHQTSASSAFRAGHSEEHIARSENDFSSFLDGTDVLTPPQDFGSGQPEDLADAWSRTQLAREFTTTRAAGFRTIEEQETHDGEEVLSILSAPGGMGDSFEPPQEDVEDYDWGLTREQVDQLRSMTKDILPPPEQHTSISAENPLNLIPDLDAIDSTNGQPQMATDAWREQWEGVLTRYTDEVWGGLLPLVKEARKEVEELQKNGDTPAVQPKALRRLGAILGHLRTQ